MNTSNFDNRVGSGIVSSSFETDRVATGPGATTCFAGVDLVVHEADSTEDCLQAPAGYLAPTVGNAAEAARRVARWFAGGGGKALWLQGPCGVGKDAMIRALSERTRCPAVEICLGMFSDFNVHLSLPALGPIGPRWDDGMLLRALRDGYIARDGRVWPYLVVLTGVDEIVPERLVWLRGVLDDSRHVTSASGSHPVLPGTRIVVTSVVPPPADLASRFAHHVVLTPLEPEDEGAVLREKYPSVATRFPTVIPWLLGAAARIRAAFAAGSLDARDAALLASHRTLDAAMAHLECSLAYDAPGHDADALREAARTISERCTVASSRNALSQLGILRLDDVRDTHGI